MSLLNPASLRQVFREVTISDEVLELISLDDMFCLVESSINLSNMASAMKIQTAQSPTYSYRYIPSCLLSLPFSLALKMKASVQE